MRVRYGRTALRDLAGILVYLNDRSPGGARNVMRSIQKAAELVGEYPNSGRLAGEGNVRVVQAGRYPYLIYWEVSAEGPTIVHIRHAARRPWPPEERS